MCGNASVARSVIRLEMAVGHVKRLTKNRDVHGF
jgi:hypothetical protein